MAEAFMAFLDFFIRPFEDIFRVLENRVVAIVLSNMFLGCVYISKERAFGGLYAYVLTPK